MIRSPSNRTAVRAERIGSSLQMRTIGLAGANEWPIWRAIYIIRGDMEIRSPELEFARHGPCVVWTPWTPDHRLKISAGSGGIHFVVDEAALNNALGHKAESADLKSLAGSTISVALAGNEDIDDAIAHCFKTVLREADREAAASNTVIEAMIRVILIMIWRCRGAPGPNDASANPAQKIMNRFNILVEARFRERWPVAKYATTLGISADRLNDICRRSQHKSPKQIIDQFVRKEACLLLENSTHSVDQISELLGFRSPAQFNRYFKSLCGIPPGTFRRRMRLNDPAIMERKFSNLHDWP